MRLAHAQVSCQRAVFDSMEITQAIQLKDNPQAPDNSVPLVASRGTTVRVYMRPDPPGCTATVHGVGGSLQYSADGSPWSGVQTIWVADNGLISVSSSDTNQTRRLTATKTLNYTFLAPPAGDAATVLLGLRFKPYGSEQQWSTWQSVALNKIQKLIRIGGIPIRNTQFLPDGGLIREGRAELALFGTWPLTEPRGPRGAGPNSPAYYKLGPWHASLDFPSIGGLGVPYDTVLLLLKELQKDHPVDFLFGWVDDASAFVGTGVSCAGSPRLDCHTGMGEDSQPHYQGKIAHEFGHEIFQDNTETNTQLMPEVGWDVGFAAGHLGLGNIKPPPMYNMMYGGIHPVTGQQFATADRWTTAQTYSDAFGRVQSARPPFEKAEALAIPVSPDLTTIPGHVFQFTRDGERLVPGGAGMGELRLRDDHGQVLYQTKFDAPVLRFEDPAIPDQAGTALIQVPYSAAVEDIELYKGGVLQYTLSKSPNPPSVTIVQPQPGDTLTDTVTIEWQASDVDGDPLAAEVLYSKDGSAWQSLLVNASSTNVTVDTADLASSAAATIRVRVSDRFDTTIANVGGLELGPNRPPEAWFWQPEAGAVYYSGANVMLLGAADDLEDASIPDTSVAWYSDRDGFLAQGYTVNTTSLSIGTHQIELRVTDSAGTSTSAFATVQVQAAP